MQVVSLLLVFILLTVVDSLAATRTVDCDGGTPYSDIQAAINDATAGDTIRVRDCTAGTGFYEQALLFSGKIGTAANPIILEPESGHSPKLRFCTTDNESAHVKVVNSQYVYVRNFGAPGGVRTGTGGFIYTGCNSPQRLIFAQANGQTTRDIQFTGNYVKDFGRQQPAAYVNNGGYQGIFFAGPSGTPLIRVLNGVISQNIIDGFRRNIIRLSSTQNALVEYNHISGLRCGPRAPNLLKNETIKLTGRNTNDLPAIGTIVRGNTVIGTTMNEAACEAEVGMNDTSGVGYKGIYCDVEHIDAIIERNFVFDHDEGEDASAIHIEARCDNHIVQHNIIKDAQDCFKISSPSSITRDHINRNNTCDDVELGLKYEEDHFIISHINNANRERDGVSNAILFDADVDLNFAGPTTGINNNYYSYSTTDPFVIPGDGTATFTQYKSFCNCDANSTLANTPGTTLWHDPANNDYTPKVGSPLINAGTGSPAIGAAKDVGALESPTCGNCTTIDGDTWQCTCNAIFTPITGDCSKITPRRVLPSPTSGTATACQTVGSTNVRFDVVGFVPSSGNTLAVDFAYGAIQDGARIGGSINARQQAVTGVPVTNTLSGTAPTLSSCSVHDQTRNVARVIVDLKGSGALNLGLCPTGWNVQDDGANQTETSCTAVATGVFDLIVAGVLTTVSGTGNTVTYDATVGNATNGSGVEIVSGTITCTTTIGQSPPTLDTVQVFNADRNAAIFTFDLGGGTTLLPATGITGLSVSGMTATACDRLGTMQVKCVYPTAFAAGASHVAGYTPGNLTDNALVPVQTVSGIPVLNEVQGDTGVVSMVRSALFLAHSDYASARRESAEVTSMADAPFTRIAPEGIARISHRLDCVGTCPSRPYVPYCSLNGATALPVGNIVGDNKVALASDRVVTLNPSPITSARLTACGGTFVPGSLYLLPLTVFPAVALANGECIEYAYNMRFDKSLAGGDVLVCGMQADGGGVVVQTAPLTIIVGAGGGIQ